MFTFHVDILKLIPLLFLALFLLFIGSILALEKFTSAWRRFRVSRVSKSNTKA